MILADSTVDGVRYASLPYRAFLSKNIKRPFLTDSTVDRVRYASLPHRAFLSKNIKLPYWPGAFC